MIKKKRKQNSAQSGGTQEKRSCPPTPESGQAYNDIDNVRFDENGDPQPGYNWNGPLERMIELQEKEQGQIVHHHGFEVDMALQSAGNHFGLPRTRGLFIYPKNATSNVETVADTTIREKCGKEIQVCGQAVLRAWLNKDNSFFQALARRANIYFGPRSSGSSLKELEVIKIAQELWHDGLRNPSRKQVKETAKERGIKISEKDWPGYFVRCNLEFLKDQRGRPKKKEASSGCANPDKDFKIPAMPVPFSGKFSNG